MTYYDHEAQRDTTCDHCNAEIPKGGSAVVDDDTSQLFCGVECWEDATAPEDDTP